MSRFTNTLRAAPNIVFVVAAFLLASELHASSTYATSVTAATSLTISAATSGMTGRNFGVYLIDGNSVKRPTSEFTYVINPSTYSVVVTFDPAFTGTVKLKGLFGGDTSHGYDFLLTQDGDVEGGINICDGCVDTSTGYARRSLAGIHYVSTQKSSASIDLGCNGAWTYAYIQDNQLYFGIGNGACIGNVVNARIATGLWTYPQGSIPLGKVRVYFGALDTPVDERPF